MKYRKIPKVSPGAYIFQTPLLRGLVLEGLIFGGAYLRREICRFKIDWASLIVGRKFTVFSSFYYVFEGNFQVHLEGRFNGFFCVTRLGGSYLEGLIHGGDHFWNFTVL